METNLFNPTETAILRAFVALSEENARLNNAVDSLLTAMRLASVGYEAIISEAHAQIDFLQAEAVKSAERERELCFKIANVEEDCEIRLKDKEGIIAELREENERLTDY